MINIVYLIRVNLYNMTDESLINMKNHIIFATNYKIFFYDYVTDGIKQIN